MILYVRFHNYGPIAGHHYWDANRCCVVDCEPDDTVVGGLLGLCGDSTGFASDLAAYTFQEVTR